MPYVYRAAVASRLSALGYDAHDPLRLAAFWSSLLAREVVEDVRGAFLPGTDRQVGLRFAPGRVERVGRDRVHLHLTSASHADQDRQVAAALSLGAAHLDVGQRPDEGHVVLADPEGNEFCVIGAGSAFLSGCGLLGEIACDGTREVGLFWAEALGWPLVWDQDRRPRSSPRTAVRRSRGVARRWRPSTSGTGSGSS